MPKIPDYQSQVRMTENAGTVPVPTGAAVLPAEAAAKAFGVGAKYAAEVDSIIDQGEAAAEVAAGRASAAVKLNDLRNQFLDSPYFNLHPAETRARYEEEVRKVGEGIQSGMKSGIGQEYFREEFDKLAASHFVQFSNDVRRARVNLTQAGYLQAMDQHVQAAASAPDDRIFTRNMNWLAITKAGMVASGAYGADQAEAMYQTAVRNAVRGRAELGLVNNPAQLLRELSDPNGKYGELHAETRASLTISAENRVKHLQNVDSDAKITAATQSVFNQFRLDKPDGDLAGALAYAGNPNNLAAMGLTETKQLAQVQGWIATEYSRQETLRQRQEKQKADAFSQGAINKFVDGKLTIGEITAADVPAETKQHWVNALAAKSRREERPNPELYSKLLADIWSGEITEVQQLIPHMGPGGISGTQAQNLRQSIKEAQEPIKSQWFQMSREMYRSKYKGDDEMMQLLPEFLNNLDWHVKSEGLKGQAIFDRAKELMTAKEESRFWKFWQSEEDITPQFKREIETQPWKANPAPAVDPKISERIQQLRTGGMADDDIRKALSDKGIDPRAYGL